MKKIILGLFLTVGFTAFASANNVAEIYPNVENTELASCSLDINDVIEVPPVVLKSKCSYITVTRYLDCEGKIIYSQKGEAYTGDCGSRPDNSITYTFTHVTIC